MHARFLRTQKPALRLLLAELSRKYAYASVLATDVAGTRYQVQKRESSVEDSFWTERGFVVRVYNGVGYTEYAANSVPGDSPGGREAWVRDLAAAVAAAVRTAESTGTARISTPLIREEALTAAYGGAGDDAPEPDSRAVLRRLSGLKDRAEALSEAMIDIRVVYEQVRVSKLFLSDSRDLEQTYRWSQGYLVPIYRRDGITRYTVQSFSGLGGEKLIAGMEESLADTLQEGALLLDAGQVMPGEYEVILSPEVAGLLAHEAFGHGVETDMFVKNRARAQEYLDRAVGSPLVTMHDGARAAEEVSSYYFDDEGTLGQDTTIIAGGILQRGISDLLSALQLGSPPTGNGRRESFERKAYARMTNTFFAPGPDRLEDMIASLKHGYLLEKFTSGMEDPKNWGIQCVILYGREIRNGEFTGKRVSPVIMTGYVPDLLGSISMVSGDLGLKGSGMCGKGHKEYAKTASGGPYIKAKARLG
jgi:TldD protein